MSQETIALKLQTEANRCVGKVMEQLDIIQAPEGTKKTIRRAIWDLKDDIGDQLAKQDKEKK